MPSLLPRITKPRSKETSLASLLRCRFWSLANRGSKSRSHSAKLRSARLNRTKAKSCCREPATASTNYSSQKPANTPSPWNWSHGFGLRHRAAVCNSQHHRSASLISNSPFPEPTRRSRSAQNRSCKNWTPKATPLASKPTLVQPDESQPSGSLALVRSRRWIC